MNCILKMFWFVILAERKLPVKVNAVQEMHSDLVAKNKSLGTLKTSCFTVA